MKQLITLTVIPFVILSVLTSCTVVEKTPATTTSTTVHRETAVTAPATTSTTTTRTSGGY